MVNFTPGRSLAMGAMLSALCGNIFASGFALPAQNASGLGNAHASGAAGTEDASTIFFNPAGMSRLPGKQAVAAGHLMQTSVKFTGTGPGNTGSNAGGVAFIPSGYFSAEFNPSIWYGVGINSPFGFVTEYDPLWVGQRHAIKTRVATANVNPSVAYRINDAVTIGAGINYQRIQGTLTSESGGTGRITVKGSDNAWGYNLGVLYNMTPQTRFGFAYRSSIDFTLSGDLTYGNPSSTYQDRPVTWTMKMPDSFSSSVFHRIDDQWDLMADVTWMGWSKFQRLDVVGVTGAAPGSPALENWEDTWRIAAGVNHHYSDRWMSRIGLAYDPSPVPDQHRTASFPDSDRIWFSLGGQHQPTRESVIDFGYAHLFAKDSTVATSFPAPALSGRYQGRADILSIQYTHRF